MPGGIWNGTIAFGLVSIPVKLHTATSSHDPALHQYHASDAGRIRYWKVCELDDKDVPPEDIVKGVEVEGEVVLIDEDDLDDLPVSSSKSAEVVEFVPVEQIDPIHFEKTYYAEPGKGAAKPYVLLREALAESGKIAIVRITLRRRETLAALRPRGDLLLVHTMLWPDEIRRPEFAGAAGEVREQELAMAATLIESMSDDFRPEEYSDAYREALEALIAAKSKGRKAPAKKQRAEPAAKVIDLADALQQSLDAQGGPKRRPAKQAAKQTAARKRTAKKTAAKKTAAKKAARRKSA
ncbi:non-homologous end joining protein Ku [Glycomyces terrestris]|uniref:Non-homologous end joining protein Ku n=1 Tax=Glycomyces terrestris TaxID=2493553 RepID=A0A426V429_9ACTN|nr:Ku protein [Glycomyces terrestris]RRS01580.1 Ku protein [Glycomyces terrestris]